MVRTWLIQLRGKRTQGTIAEALGIHTASYAHYELGTRTPSVALAKKIGECMGFDWTLFYENKNVDTTKRAN